MRETFPFFTFCRRRGDPPCARLRLRVRDRVPRETGGRVPRGKTHGPGRAVQEEGTHFGNKVSTNYPLGL